MIYVFYFFNLPLVYLLTKMISEWCRKSIVVSMALIISLFLLDFYVFLWLSCTMWTVFYMLLVMMLASYQFPVELHKNLFQSIRENRFWIFFLSVVTTSFLLFVFLPITIFLSSPDEIRIHLEYLLSTNIKNAMVLVYLALIFYALLISSHLKTLLTFFCASLLGVFVLYTYLLPFGYPMMNGLMFEQLPIGGLALLFRSTVDIIIVIAVSIGTYFLLCQKKKFFVQGILIFNISILIASFIRINEKEIHYFEESPSENIEAYPLKYSAEGKNVLILFLDRFMGGFVEKLLEDDPSLYENLSGFTWYPRTIAAGINSIAGLHPLLGGYDYTPGAMNHRDETLVQQSVESFSILPYNFTKNGYQVNFINPRGLGFTMLGDCDYLKIEGCNCSHIPTNISIDMAKAKGIPTEFLVKSSYSDLMVLLGIMRATPYMFKNVLNKRGPWQPFLDHSAGTTFKAWSELKALPQLSSVQSSQNNLNIFFNILPHEPYFIGEDGKPQQSRTNFPKDVFEGKGFNSLFAYQHFLAAKATLNLVSEYLEWMKQNGIYDNTQIVIVSDHGIVGETEDHSSRAVKGGTVGNLFVASRSLLLIKERNQDGPLKVSEEFIPNASVPEIVCKEIGSGVNPFLNDKPLKTFGRDDPFYVYVTPWQFSMQKEKEFIISHKFKIINRDPFDIKNWIEVNPKEN